MKIGDFGTSTSISITNTTTYLATSAGTPGYMAPEVGDTSIPRTDRVDIWSLGCILYRMVTGSPLFNSRRDVWRYADREPSPPWAVKNKGFSVACEDFLRDVLQPSPEDRPSAEDCLKAGWIMSGVLGSGGRIGSDIYRRLAKIELAAPDIDTFSDMAALRAADNTLARGFAIGATSVTGSTASRLRPAKTFDTGTPSPGPTEADGYGVTVRKPPAWKLNYRIGTSAFGTIFLEKVQTRRMESPEFWAVKRIPMATPNFSPRRYQEEVRNLQALSNVSLSTLASFLSGY